jgi:outer membrane protein assembly factor BamD
LRKIYLAILLVLIPIIFGCSGSVDTSKLNSEEYYNYAFKLYQDEDYEISTLEFQNFILQYSGSAFNDDAQFYLAMSYSKKGQHLLAAYEFSKLIRNIPASPFVPESQFMLAESYYNIAPPFPLDQSYTKKAIEEYQAFVDFFPTNSKAEEAENKIKELTERLAQKEYQSALIYERMQYDRAAIKYYGTVAETYHDTKYAPLSLYNKINIEVKKGMNSEALADINLFLSRYKDHPNAKEIQQLESSLIDKK